MTSCKLQARTVRRLRRQHGVTLIEVLIAMLLFLAAASALVLMINQAYIANAQSLRTFAATSTARSLLATIEGNPGMLGTLNGTKLDTSSSSTSSGALAPVYAWWSTQMAQYPDLQSLSVSTMPNGASSSGACSATAPCQITADITVRSAFGGTIKHTFVLQDGF